jgi:hypothetical protein
MTDKNQPKPITKALHTRRVVYRVALHLASREPGSYLTGGEVHSLALLREVLALLNNAPAADPKVAAELLDDCTLALIEVRENFRSMRAA